MITPMSMPLPISPQRQQRFHLETALVVDGPRRVYKALDLVTRQTVALKGMLSTAPDWPSPLLAEASLLRRLSHPALVPMLELVCLPPPPDEPINTAFYAFTQPWIDGPSLRQRAASMSPADLRQWLVEALEAIAWLHHHGLTRLDLKPDHFLWDGLRWRLIDLDQVQRDDPFAHGALHGTLHYLAPECLGPDAGGPVSDLFSLGAILLEAATGSLPELKGEGREQLLEALLHRPDPRFPAEYEAQAPDVVRLGRRLLSPQPSARPASALEALSELTDTSAKHWRRIPPAPPAPALENESTALLTPLIQRCQRSSNSDDRPSGGMVTLVAPARAGRTTQLERLADALVIAGVEAFFLKSQPDALSAEPGVERTIRWLWTLPGQPPPVMQPEPASSLADSTQSHGALLEVRIQALLQNLLDAARARQRLTSRAAVLLLDDPAELDDVSQLVLRRLALLLPGTGIWCILAGRGCEPEAPPWPGTELLTMQPMSRAALREWTDAVLGAGALESPAVLETVLQATEGWPGRVHDLVAMAWLEPECSLETLAARMATSTTAVTVDEVQVTLPVDLLGPAQCAAVLEGTFDEALFSAVLDESCTPVTADTLEQAGLLQRVSPDSAPRIYHGGAMSSVYTLLKRVSPANEPRGVPTREENSLFSFKNEADRQALLQTLSHERARELHLRAAEALEQRLAFVSIMASTNPQADAPSNALPDAIVRHFLAAEPRRALPHMPRAIEVATAALRLSGAIHLLDTWGELLRRSDPLRAELLRRSGQLALELGRFEDARGRFETALEQPGLKDGPVRARCLAGMGRALMKLGRYEDARPFLELAVHPAGRCEMPELLCWYHWLAWLHGALSDRDAAGLESMRSTLEMTRTSVPPGSRLAVDQQVLELELGLRTSEDVKRLIPLQLATLALAQTLRYEAGETRLLTCALILYDRLGDVGQQQEIGARLLELARHGFDLEGEMRISNNLGMLLRDQGRSLDAYDHFARAAALAARLGREMLELRYRHEGVDVLLRAGRLDRAGLELAATAKLLAQALIPTGSGLTDTQTLAQRLLETRRRVLQHIQARSAPGVSFESDSEADVLDQALATLVTQANDPEQEYLQLEAVADRMMLALERGLVREALQYLAPVLGREELPETRLAWQRLHVLAATAHGRLQGGTSPDVSRTGPDAKGGRSPEQSGRPEQIISDSGKQPAALSQPATRPSPRHLEAPDRWLERVIRVLEVADGEEKLAVRLAELAGDTLGGRGLVLFFGEHNEVLELAELRRNPVSRTLVQLVRETGEPHHTPDVRFDPLLSSARSIRDLVRPSILCQPIRRKLGPPLGVVYVDDLEQGRSNDPAAVRVVEQVAELAETLLEAFARRRLQEQQLAIELGWLGSSSAMQQVARQVQLYAGSDLPELSVLLLGETGVGKSLIAEAIHSRSRWKDSRFITVNCAAIPGELFESEMFGHKKGAFTGAYADKSGYFEQVGDGTLFLDELGDISLEHQAKLLLVLSCGEFRRVGDDRVLRFQGRILCATNRDLEAMVRQGTFRADLLSRLAVNVCRIPTLRERGPDDLRLLICHMLQKTLEAGSVTRDSQALPGCENHFTRKALRYLFEHSWPGNVRELQNLFRNELIRQRLRAGELVDDALLHEALQGGLNLARLGGSGSETVSLASRLPTGMTLKELRSHADALIADYVLRVVEAHGGDKNAAAGALKCARDSVYKYLDKLKQNGGRPG